MSDPRRAYGAAGEERAAAWYRARGYRVLDRNWRCRDGELDLVVARGRLLVFVEVKARRTDRFGSPLEAVTRTKQLRLRRLALRYLEATGARPSAMRFDVVSILAGHLEVVEAAFLCGRQLRRGGPRGPGGGTRRGPRSPSRCRPCGSRGASGTG